VINISAIETNKGYYISVATNSSYSPFNSSSLSPLLFDGVKADYSFHSDWLFIKSKPNKITHMKHQENNNYRFVLTDDTLSDKLQKEIPREQAGTFVKDCNGEHFEWKPELAFYRSLYIEVSDEQPDIEVEDEFTFEVVFKIAEIVPPPSEFNYLAGTAWNSFKHESYDKTINRPNIEHQLLDKIIFPSLIIHETPCRLSSEESYEIIRSHVKRNINPVVAKVTSDYDFCFAVAKVIKLANPYSKPITYTPRGKRKPVTETRMVTAREVQIFEMTNAKHKYSGYTVIQGFEGNNERALKEQIDNYLADLMVIINKPLVDCHHCNGTGVIDNG
jgi:hypothetical protein